jgi:hypothetical protein
MRKLSLVFFIASLILSCADKAKVPKDILPPEKMQLVLWDMISAGEFLNGYILNKDSADKVAESSIQYGQVFQVQHITREDFEKSWQYYRDHPALMKVVLDSLNGKKANYGQHPLKADSTTGHPDSAKSIGRDDSLLKKKNDSVPGKIRLTSRQ